MYLQDKTDITLQIYHQCGPMTEITHILGHPTRRVLYIWIRNEWILKSHRTAEEPEQLKRELDASVERLAYLISRINLTNSQTKVDGRTLTELIARKDALILKIGVYKDIVYTGSQTSYRARNTEIKIKTAISVTDWQDEIDKMAKELRLLDNKLQENNWSTDMIE